MVHLFDRNGLLIIITALISYLHQVQQIKQSRNQMDFNTRRKIISWPILLYFWFAELYFLICEVRSILVNCNLQLLSESVSLALFLFLLSPPPSPLPAFLFLSLFLSYFFSGVSGCLLNFIFRTERFQRSTPSSEHTSLNGLLTW